MKDPEEILTIPFLDDAVIRWGVLILFFTIIGASLDASRRFSFRTNLALLCLPGFAVQCVLICYRLVGVGILLNYGRVIMESMPYTPFGLLVHAHGYVFNWLPFILFIFLVAYRKKMDELKVKKRITAFVAIMVGSAVIASYVLTYQRLLNIQHHAQIRADGV